MSACPCCGRKYQVARQSSDKKLAEDRARAQAAINALERFNPAIPAWAIQPQSRRDSLLVNPSVQASIEAELTRMREALNNPALLWSIYRRRDKAAGYASQGAGPKMAEQERQLQVA